MVANKPVGAVTGNHSNSTLVVSSTRVQGQKRKSDTAPPASDDEQLVAGKKKAKNSQSADPSNHPIPPQGPQRPAPHPTSRVLKAQATQLVASGRKSILERVSGVAIETADEQAATRKRPAEGEVVDNTLAPVSRPPSKKVKASNAIANKPQPLRHTGSFFHIGIGNKMLQMF